MSTFDGHVAEFPRIRIDRFRLNDGSTVPSLANFLSHIHTDHLVGLDSPSYGGPFIYCSSATREMLLRLEKYPTRMNFANAITETRTQTYKHLKRLLKPIPLEVPTWIELSDGYRIRVTLFDANHCAGAVSFLIEGEGPDAKAIMYTGDLRAEQWWVHSLSRYPFLNQYIRHDGKEPHKRLDTIYLDTTFANKSDPYQHFPTKSQGIAELLSKVAQYPKDTLFYLNTWTFGYEDVWSAIATFLDTKIHVDQYKYGVYAALGNSKEPRAVDFFKLIQSSVGNHAQQGCLVTDGQPQLIHSCEQGTPCHIWNEEFVRITPIISRYGGKNMREPGAGGGEDDLNRQYEIQFQDQSEMIELVQLIDSKYRDQPDLRMGIIKLLKDELSSRGAVSLGMTDVHPNQGPDGDSQEPLDMDDMTLEDLVTALASRTNRIKKEMEFNEENFKHSGSLPKQIVFPYSRHSSFSELCALIEAFKPKDIYPCTVVPEKHWKPNHSMSYLFGHLYSEPPNFSHDQLMLHRLGERSAIVGPPRPQKRMRSPEARSSRGRSPVISSTPTMSTGKRKSLDVSEDMQEHIMLKRKFEVPSDAVEESVQSDSEADEALNDAQLRDAFRIEASDAALGNRGLHWSAVGLVSVSGHREEEEELC